MIYEDEERRLAVLLEKCKGGDPDAHVDYMIAVRMVASREIEDALRAAMRDVELLRRLFADYNESSYEYTRDLLESTKTEFGVMRAHLLHRARDFRRLEDAIDGRLR